VTANIGPAAAHRRASKLLFLYGIIGTLLSVAQLEIAWFANVNGWFPYCPPHEAETETLPAHWLRTKAAGAANGSGTGTAAWFGNGTAPAPGDWVWAPYGRLQFYYPATVSALEAAAPGAAGPTYALRLAPEVQLTRAALKAGAGAAALTLRGVPMSRLRSHHRHSGALALHSAVQARFRGRGVYYDATITAVTPLWPQSASPPSGAYPFEYTVTYAGVIAPGGERLPCDFWRPGSSSVFGRGSGPANAVRGLLSLTTLIMLYFLHQEYTLEAIAQVKHDRLPRWHAGFWGVPPLRRGFLLEAALLSAHAFPGVEAFRSPTLLLWLSLLPFTRLYLVLRPLMANTSLGTKYARFVGRVTDVEIDVWMLLKYLRVRHPVRSLGALFLTTLLLLGYSLSATESVLCSYAHQSVSFRVSAHCSPMPFKQAIYTLLLTVGEIG
jgi:hypothetical protein